MINWKKYFDKVYCIHYLPFNDRLNNISLELDRVGLLNNNIFRWKFTFDSPFYEKLNLQSNINLYHKSLNNKSIFNCTLAHYEVYKEAHALNYNRILVLEDDILFLKDLDILQKYLDSMPTDMDVILFDKLTGRIDRFICALNNKVNDYYCKFNDGFSSAGFYSLTHSAMKQIIERQECALRAADQAWVDDGIDNLNLNKCFSAKNLGIQQEYMSCYTVKSQGNIINYCYNIMGVNRNEY